MAALLAHGDFDGALWQANALEAYTRGEPLPWTDFLVRRARALAAAGKGAADRAELLACRERALAMHLPGAVPALDDALARV
jgi:hypothetical protein